MQSRDYRLKLNEFQTEEKPEQFTLKPNRTIYCYLVVIFGFMLFRPQPVVLIGGAFFLALPLINIFLIRNKPILDIYQNYFVVHDIKDSEIGYKIPWEAVEEYSFQAESYHAQVFVIRLKNGNSFAIPSSQYAIGRAFQKRIPEKERFKKNQLDREARQQKRKAERSA